MSTTLPPQVDLAVIHALHRSPAWSASVDIGVVRRIVETQLDQPHNGAVDLSPLFRYLAAQTERGTAARCVREIADGMAGVGVASVVPDLVMKRGTPAPELEITKPERKRAMAAPAGDHLPLVGFACFLALIAGCVVFT